MRSLERRLAKLESEARNHAGFPWHLGPHEWTDAQLQAALRPGVLENIAEDQLSKLSRWTTDD